MAKENTFNEQAFLLDFFELTVDANIEGRYIQKPKEYKHFTQLTGDPTAVVNKLVGAGAGAVLGLKTHQLPLLVPQVRIFKIYQHGSSRFEKEFFFDDYTSVESITKSTVGRGQDAGLTSFTWNDMGTNPANSGLSFEAEMKLYFQSFESVFKDRGDGMRFADLLIPARGKDKKKKTIEQISEPQTQAAYGGKKTYDDADYRIKAVVGWATPSDPGKTIFSDPTIIDRTRVSLLLTLTTHDIDIREDGSVELTLKYNAALEGRMMSQKADLLRIPFIGPEGAFAARTLIKKQEEVVKAIVKVENARGPAKEAKADVDIADLEAETGGRPDFSKLLSKESLKDRAVSAGKEKELRKADEDLKNKNLELKNAEHSVAVFERDGITRAYKRLLSQIENKDHRRIFYFDLSPVQYHKYQTLDAQVSTEIKLQLDNKNKKLSRSAKQEIARERRYKTKQEILDYGGGVVRKSQSGKTEALELVVDKMRSMVDKDKRSIVLRKAKTERTTKPDLNNFTLNFFYLGDLVDAALEIINSDEDGSPIDPGRKKQFGFMLGTIDLYDISSNNLVTVPLSDIPISLNMFNNWFQKKVIEPERRSFPFQQFIRSLCSELIFGVLRNQPYPPGGKAKMRLSMSNYLLPSRAITGGRRAINSIKSSIEKNLVSQANIKEISKLKQFLFLYTGGTMNKYVLKGNEETDKNLNIFHFFVGADQSIVKNISFKRTDLPYQREARIERASRGAEANLLFSDFYNAQITMIGNAIFKPGMLLFIDPISMGLGNWRSHKSNANLMGIGGYYLVIRTENIIESGKFETILTLVAQSGFGNIQAIRTSVKLPMSPGEYVPPPVNAISIEDAATRGELAERTVPITVGNPVPITNNPDDKSYRKLEEAIDKGDLAAAEKAAEEYAKESKNWTTKEREYREAQRAYNELPRKDVQGRVRQEDVLRKARLAYQKEKRALEIAK